MFTEVPKRERGRNPKSEEGKSLNGSQRPFSGKFWNGSHRSLEEELELETLLSRPVNGTIDISAQLTRDSIIGRFQSLLEGKAEEMSRESEGEGERGTFARFQ